MLNTALGTYEHLQFPQGDSEKALCLGRDLYYHGLLFVAPAPAKACFSDWQMLP